MPNKMKLGVHGNRNEDRAWKANADQVKIMAEAVVKQVMLQIQGVLPEPEAAPPAIARTNSSEHVDAPTPALGVPVAQFTVARAKTAKELAAEALANLRVRVQLALTHQALSNAQLAKTLGEKQDAVDSVVRVLRTQREVYNVGLGESPTWTWKIGDNTDSRILNALIRRLLSERPMTASCLAEATGARPARVSGQLVEIQRHPGPNTRIVDMSGGQRTKMYLLLNGNVRDMHLEEPVRSPKGDE